MFLSLLNFQFLISYVENIFIIILIHFDITTVMQLNNSLVRTFYLILSFIHDSSKLSFKSYYKKFLSCLYKVFQKIYKRGEMKTMFLKIFAYCALSQHCDPTLLKITLTIITIQKYKIKHFV